MTPAMARDLNPPPTLMPTARLTTNDPIGVVFPPIMKLITVKYRKFENLREKGCDRSKIPTPILNKSV
ncbi:hypothetical protein [Scytonema sp. HK-05]|uniref:hypothetical protein n=1 Tax=Scytonema sp. HK-05 TaxID=1137095 RepID=UPI000AE67CF2|nr:hypothetical protein [Scytonema sp. HK-05]